MAKKTKKASPASLKKVSKPLEKILGVSEISPPAAIKGIWDYIKKMKKETNLTVFMTTHYMQEAEVCDRIAIIDHGHIVDLDSPVNLKHNHGEKTLEEVFLKLTGRAIREQAGESAWSQWMRR